MRKYYIIPETVEVTVSGGMICGSGFTVSGSMPHPVIKRIPSIKKTEVL